MRNRTYGGVRGRKMKAGGKLLHFPPTRLPLHPQYFTMTRIEREKQTVCRMIELYCRHHLKEKTMPDEYQHLVEFACRRLDHCKYGEQKTACKDCPTHCYAPKEREQIRKIMRWVGPRMIFYSPIEAIRHIFNK